MSVGKRRRDALQRKAALSAACPRTGKRRFRSLEAARRVLDDAAWWREHGDEKRQERRAYECEHCAGWHVSSLETWVDKPRTPIPPVSVKRAKEQRQRTKMLRETFGTNPDCARCGRPADDAHEILSRARGGSITDPANIAPLCRPCHDWVTTEPALAEAEGWSVAS